MPPKDYEIRSRIDDYGTISEEEPEAMYDSINLMVYLLGDIKYTVVYGKLSAFLKEFSKNVDALPAFVPQKRGLQAFVTDLLGQLGSSSFELRVLFQQRLLVSDPHYFVVRAFRNLRNNPIMSGLCLPFMNIQDGDPDIISSTDMGRHIDNIGKYSLYELFYDKAKKDLTQDERDAMKNARKLGIFSYPPTNEEFRVLDNRMMAGGSNYRVCDPSTGKCKTSLSGWCNSDANGNCSAMSSDPPPPAGSPH